MGEGEIHRLDPGEIAGIELMLTPGLAPRIAPQVYPIPAPTRERLARSLLLAAVP